jgi:lipopolysaccharide export system permease protein
MPAMKRLDRYLIREMIIPFLIGQGAVVLMLTGTVLYNNADTFLNYGIPALGIAKIAFYFLPYLVNLTMPVAMAIAASLTVSRLTRDTEITVMRAAGISLKRIFLPIFAIGLLVSLGDFYFGERIVPWMMERYDATMNELSRTVKFLVPQEKQVVQSPDKKYTVFVERMELRPNGARMYKVMLIISGPTGSTPGVVLADTADYKDGLWKLRKYRAFLYEAGGLREKVALGDTMDINFRLPEKTFNLISLQLPLYSSAANISFRELGERIALERRAGWVNKRDLLDYYFKLSVPFSCLVFALACPPLALRFARAGNFMGVLLSIILVFVYWNTLLAAKILGAKYPDIIPPLAAGWGQNILFAAVGLYFLWRGE